MKKQEDYRIKIEEWKEITDIGVVSKKHVKFWVQKRYFSKSWFARIILKEKDIWYDQTCHSTENEALIAIRNQYNRENPTTNYIKY
jgi:hypothetical protein